MICYNIIAHKLAQAAFHVLKEQTDIVKSCCLGVKLCARETPNPERLTEPLPK